MHPSGLLHQVFFLIRDWCLWGALEYAEQLNEKYREPHRIVPFNKGTFSITVMSGEEYEQYKIAALLNVSIEDVRRFAEAT